MSSLQDLRMRLTTLSMLLGFLEIPSMCVFQDTYRVVCRSSPKYFIVWLDYLRHSQHFSVISGRVLNYWTLPGLNHYLTRRSSVLLEDTRQCLQWGPNPSISSQGLHPSISSQGLYHMATALIEILCCILRYLPCLGYVPSACRGARWGSGL